VEVLGGEKEEVAVRLVTLKGEWAQIGGKPWKDHARVFDGDQIPR